MKWMPFLSYHSKSHRNGIPPLSGIPELG
jgi:hypothetical protein